ANEEKLKELEGVKHKLEQSRNDLSLIQKDFHGIPRLNTVKFKDFVPKFKEDGASDLMYTLW
ncbi:hypothetical protein TorRG33x02_351220, partial [Trema orientale]